MKISSNTIVKQGMPFIGKVLEQVAPYMEKMIIHLSTKSTDGTFSVINQLNYAYPDKIELYLENVDNIGQLTSIRNEQVKKTKSDWILFLDDDDYWATDQLELCLNELDKDPNILAYSVNPYQLTDWEHYDTSWNNRSFSKFLRRKGLQFIHPYPRDMPADKNEKLLYWKTNALVKKLPYKFYHLSYLKNNSFRNEEWAKKFAFQKGRSEKLEKPLKIL
jgi:glycosyltransferase involved in cell wall biosynthesis